MIARIKTWLNHETSSITIAALLLAAASFAADTLGLLRDRILATQFGAGETLDVYYAAFRIPDLLLNLLILGAVSSAFLPVFAERYGRDREDAWRLTANFLTVAALALVLFAVALFFAIPTLMPLIAPGFESEAMERAVRVTRILLMSPILFGLSSIISSVLHYFQRFFIYSLAPILYNLGIIIGALLFAPRFGEVGLAVGVILGAAMHLGIQIPGIASVGFRFRLLFRPLHAAIRDIVRLAIPRTVNLLVIQLQFTALTAIASLFAAGSIAVFNLGTNLAFVPVGVIGISFATAAFPVFSRAFAAGDLKAFSRTLRQTIQEILFFALPAVAFFLVLRAHIVRVVLGAGAFSWEDTRLTAAVLGAFAFGVAAQSLLPLLVRAFFAKKDTKTPLLIALFSTALTVGGTFFLSVALRGSGAAREFIGTLFRVVDLPDIRVLSLPIAMSVMATVQVLLLLFALRRHFLAGEMRRLLRAFVRLSLVSAIAGSVTWAALRPLAQGVEQETFVGIFLQGLGAGVLGVIVFLVLAFTFAFPEAQRLVGFLRRTLPPLKSVLPREDGTDQMGRRGMEE